MKILKFLEFRIKILRYLVLLSRFIKSKFLKLKTDKCSINSFYACKQRRAQDWERGGGNFGFSMRNFGTLHEEFWRHGQVYGQPLLEAD